jgi:very-short-patch-repair endonuclease
MNQWKWKVSADLWAALKPLARQNRRQPTPAEKLLWGHLRNRQLAGFKFRRQHAIERFIVDFYCAEAWLVIEIDGPIHDYTAEGDAIRQRILESTGLTVIRFSNDEVLRHTEAVLAHIAAAAKTSPSLQSGEGAGG